MDQQILENSRILHTFTQFTMFQFKQRSKKVAAEGNCIVLQSTSCSTGEPDIYLKMNNLEYIKKINNNLFARVRYENSTAFIFFDQSNQHVVYAITTNKKSTYLPILQQLLTQKAQLLDYQSSALKNQDKLRIDSHCNNVLVNQVIIHHNTTTNIGKSIGNFLGSIGKKVTKVGSKIDNKIQTFSRQSVSSETRSNWQNFKQKAAAINDKLTQLIKPISQLGSGAISKLGDSYQKSEIPMIKQIRQFTKQTEKSLNQGYIAQIQSEKPVEVPVEISQTILSMKQTQKVQTNEQQS